MSNPATAKDALRMAFEAITRGDYAERDRLIARGTKLIEAEEKANAIERVLAVDFYVTPKGTAIPTRAMARAAGEIH